MEEGIEYLGVGVGVSKIHDLRLLYGDIILVRRMMTTIYISNMRDTFFPGGHSLQLP